MKPVTLLQKLEVLVGSTALDVGARDCCNALELTKSGFDVDAVDIKDCPKSCVAENITYIQSRFEDLSTEKKYDVIIARHVVPFLTTPIEATLQKLNGMLTKNGVLYVSLFGNEDDWAGMPDVQVTDMESVCNKVAEGCAIAYRAEEQFEGKTYAGAKKKWHVITMVLVKT